MEHSTYPSRQHRSVNHTHRNHQTGEDSSHAHVPYASVQEPNVPCSAAQMIMPSTAGCHNLTEFSNYVNDGGMNVAESFVANGALQMDLPRVGGRPGQGSQTIAASPYEAALMYESPVDFIHYPDFQHLDSVGGENIIWSDYLRDPQDYLNGIDTSSSSPTSTAVTGVSMASTKDTALSDELVTLGELDGGNCLVSPAFSVQESCYPMDSATLTASAEDMSRLEPSQSSQVVMKLTIALSSSGPFGPTKSRIVPYCPQRR